MKKATKRTYCCARFKEESGSIQLSYRALGYPRGMHPTAQIEKVGKTWAVNGCCGGGCYVLSGLRYCPWCGAKLP